MTKFKWLDWCGSDVLRNEETGRNAAWVQKYSDLGYRVQIWNDKAEPQADWIFVAMVDDLDAAKMIAQLNVEGTLV